MGLEKSVFVAVFLYLLVFSIEVGSQTVPEINQGLMEPRDKIMDKAIRSFEKAAAAKLAAEADHILCYHDNMEACYQDMVVAVNSIMTLIIPNPNNAYRFVQQKGFERVVIPHLETSHKNLNIQLLKLMKIVFDAAPTATSLTMNVHFVDILLDIFENGNPPMKVHVLEILSSWLPGNPKAQARLMKRKGLLDLFYKQISNLDPVTVNQVVLIMFNKILVEHLNGRDESKVRTTTDVLNLEIYKRIGLLEQLSNPEVCRGMLAVFTRSYIDDAKYVLPVLELIKNIKPLCLVHYKGNLRALNTFKEYLKYVRNDESYNRNELVSVLQDCVETLLPTVIHEEF